MSVGPGEFSGRPGDVEGAPHELTPGEERKKAYQDMRAEDEAAWAAQEAAQEQERRERERQG